MRRFLLAATATLFAAAPAGAQDESPKMMTPEEAAAFRADWRNWSRCAVLGAVFAGYSDNAQDKADFAHKAQASEARGVALAATQGVSVEAFDAETVGFMQELQATAQNVVLLTGEMLQCQEGGMFDLSAPLPPPPPRTPGPPVGPATNPLASPSPAPRAVTPAASAPLGYTLALSVNGQGGGVTYTRTNVPGQLTGRWSLIDGSIKGEETATRAGGAAADGSLAGTYATSGISNGSRYTGRLSMTARGDAAEGRIRFYDLAWDNGDRGFGLEEGPWLHVVYGAAATGLIFPAADGSGWELHWVGPDGSRIASGKVVWRGSLTGTHTATDVNAGTTFALEIAETSPGTLRVVLPGGFAGIALKAG